MPLEAHEVERDTFSVVYAPVARSKIANDQIAIPLGFRDEWSIKLAISHALAQSTKLLLYEARMGELVNETKEMPDHLARTGKVRRTPPFPASCAQLSEPRRARRRAKTTQWLRPVRASV